MFPAMKLQVPTSASVASLLLPFPRKTLFLLLHQSPSDVRLPKSSCFSALSLQSDEASAAPPSVLTSSIASSPPLLQSQALHQWNLTHRHILMLNVIACAAAISASWLFFSAIPTLLAFKKAAESLEKLLDVTREELPDTMASIRLSGMEISDLTVELSDLGQEITKGVKSSTQAVRIAEERLRRLTTMAPTALMQERNNLNMEPEMPMAASVARGVREGIVKGREIFQIFLSLSCFSRLAMNFFTARRRKT